MKTCINAVRILCLLALSILSVRAFALADAVAKPYPPIIQGQFNSFGNSLALDSAGNRYVVGFFNAASDFNPGVGLDAKTPTGAIDSFVSRFNADGSYAWTQTVNGAPGGNTFGYSLAVSPDGLTVYATGSFSNLTKIGNAGTGVSPAGSGGTTNAFVVALNSADGSAKSTFGTGGIQKFGGTSSDAGYGVAVTATTVYVTGTFLSGGAQIGGAGPSVSPSGTNGDAFIIALNPATGAGITTFGRNLSGIQNFGAAMASQAVGYGCAVDGTTLYVTGAFTSASVGAQIGVTGPSVLSAGQQDAFVLALSSTTGAGIAGFASGGIQTFGGSASDLGFGLAVLNNTLFVGGSFASLNASIGASGPGVAASGNSQDIFVIALDKAKGTAINTFGITVTGIFTGIQKMGGSAYDNFGGLAVSGTTLYLCGSSISASNTVGGANPAVALNGMESSLATALNPVSGQPITTFGLNSSGIQVYGGAMNESPYGLAFNNGTLIMMGLATSTNAGVGALGTFDSTGFGGYLLNLDGATGKFAQPPTNITLTPSTILEGQPAGTAVGTFATSDPNPASTFIYTLAAGTGSTDNAAFRINGATLTSAAVFTAATKNSYSIRVRSTNQSGLFIESVRTVTVLPNPVISPSGVLLSNSNIPDQSQPGLAVGTLSVPNPDPKNTYSYKLNSPALGGTGTGGGGEDNGSFTITGSTLFLNAAVDFNTKNSFSVRVQVTDKAGTTNEGVFTIMVLGTPNSGGDGVPNVGNGTVVTNPVDNFSITVVSSNGGLLQLHVAASALQGRAVLDLQTEFGDIAGRSSIVPGADPAHKFSTRGIFIAKSTAIDHATGNVMGRGRKTLIISAKETGMPLAGARDGRGFVRLLGDPPNNVLAAKTIRGKFIFSATKSDSVDYVATIALPANLDISKSHELSFAIGNIVVDAMVNAKGKGTAVNNAKVLKSMKIQYQHVKKGVPTKGGETAQISVVFSSAGLTAAGFDTEGISTRSTDITAGKSGVRSIQVGMLLDGIPYSAQAPVTFAISKDSLLGTIQGRK